MWNWWWSWLREDPCWSKRNILTSTKIISLLRCYVHVCICVCVCGIWYKMKQNDKCVCITKVTCTSDSHMYYVYVQCILNVVYGCMHVMMNEVRKMILFFFQLCSCCHIHLSDYLPVYHSFHRWNWVTNCMKCHSTIKIIFIWLHSKRTHTHTHTWC